MKRLNKKGMSIIELLVCFVIVTIVAITLLNTLMEYKSEEQIESTKSYVETYKNTVSRVIESDITDYGLKGIENISVTQKVAEEYEPGKTIEGSKLEATLVFAKNFYGDNNKKTLVVYRSDKLNYIMYPDTVENSFQNVKYELKATSEIYDVDPSDNSHPDEKKSYNDLRFEFLNSEMIRIKNNSTFYLDIPISHSELGREYHIKVVAPLNLLDKTIVNEDTECHIFYYSPHGASVCNPNSLTVAKGNQYGTLCEPTRTGYKFKKWTTRENCAGETVASSTICNGGYISLSSCWEENKVKVQFNMNGGTWAGSTREEFSYDSGNYVLYNQNRVIKTYKYGEEKINLPDYDNPSYINISRVGYTTPPNKEWKLVGSNKTFQQNPSSTTNIKASDFCNASSGDCTVTLNVNWVPKTIVVTFNKNDGSPSPETQTQTFTYGASNQKFSKEFTRDGYTLKGWALTSDATEINYPTKSNVSDDWINRNAPRITVYAVWEINKYEVKYSANGGSGAPSTQTKTHGVTLTLSSTKPTKTSSTFAGWKATDNTMYNPGGSYTKNEGTTMTAQWCQNCSATSPATCSLTALNGTCTYSTSCPSGYTIVNNGKYNPSCTSCTYTVKFNKNSDDATGSMSNETFTVGTSKALTSNGFSRPGYTFAGWSKTASGSVAYTNGQTVNNLTTTCSGTVNLYAKWTVNKYNLSVQATGGKMKNKTGENNSIIKWDTQFTYGQKRGISSNNNTFWENDTPARPTRVGYEFNGWSVNGGSVSLGMNGTTPVYYFDGMYAGDVTATAQWVANTYSIAYNLNGGTHGPNHPTSITYDADFLVSNPSKKITLTFVNNEQAQINYLQSSVSKSGESVNYTFNGWNITGMDSNVLHTYGSHTTTSDTITGTKETLFKNLRSTSGTVTFTADWDSPDIVLPIVEIDERTCVWTSDGINDIESGGNYTPASATSRTFTAKCMVHQ